MTSIDSGWASRLALAYLLASTMIIAGGSGIVAAQECDPQAGNISGCEGDIGTVEAIGGNSYSVVIVILRFVGLIGVAGGLAIWVTGGVSSTLITKGKYLFVAGVVALVASGAFKPLLGLVDWIATNGV